MTMRIIQISDTHLFANAEQVLLDVNTNDSLLAVIDKVQQEEKSAELILLSGDLSQDHSETSYLRLAEIIKPLRVPAYYVPGNHDALEQMAQIFPRENILNDKQLLIRHWQIILLNSQKPGSVEGYLDHSQLAFMQRCLQDYPDHHAIILFHHHPVLVGSKWLDTIMLTNADEFWHAISNYSNVRTVLFGHVHQEHARLINNINCYSAPSTCFQFMPNQADFALQKLPPGYRWLDLHEDGRLETGVNRVASYIGKFDENAKGY